MVAAISDLDSALSGEFYVVSISAPILKTSDKEKEDINEENVYDHLFRHLLQRFEFLKMDSFVPKGNWLTYENLNSRPKASLRFTRERHILILLSSSGAVQLP